MSQLDNMLNKRQVVEKKKITLGPSVSILECGHIFVVSQANRVSHSREVSTTSCYLEEMPFVRGDLGREDGQIDRQDLLNGSFELLLF